MMLAYTRVVPVFSPDGVSMFLPTRVECSSGLANVNGLVGAGTLITVDAFFLLRVGPGLVGPAKNILEFGS